MTMNLRRLRAIAFLLVIALAGSFAESSAGNITGEGAKNKSGSAASSKKILVVYFSHTGNTREVAKQITEITGADIFEIVAEKAYPEDYETTKRIAKSELNSGYKAPIKSKVGNLNRYDVIFVGYPVWWGTFPAPVRTFLSDNSFKGKSIVPFCTHLGSGLGRSVSDIKGICPGSAVLEGIAVWGNETETSQDKITPWLRKINIIK